MNSNQREVYFVKESLLSPLILDLWKMMVKEAMEDVEERVRVGRELLKDVKFTDDQRMVEQTEKGLQTKMDALGNIVNKGKSMILR